MADDLIIDGTSVATQELLHRADLMRELALECLHLRARLAGLDRLVTMSRLQAVGAPAEAARAELDIDQAMIVMVELETQARGLQWALGTAADGYAWVERFAGELGRQVAGDLSALAGRMLPGLLLAAGGSAAVAGVGGLVVASAVAPGGLGRLLGRGLAPGVPTAPSGVAEHNELLNNPVTAGLVRDATQALGNLALGATGMPTQLATALGGTGLGVAFAAGGVMRTGSALGMFEETPVRVADSRSTRVDAAPAGFAERLDRVPDTEETGGAQVVIERYESAGEPDRFEVYIAGTVTFSPVADDEPWDMTSNLANAAGFDGGSYASVTAAMQEAGITAESPVQFTGYSQGGGTAARLAASGEWNTQGLATFGGPTGQIRIPEGFPAVIVEHREDIVPALGGAQLNRGAVLVEREIFGGREVPSGVAVPAHHLEYYAETAALMDLDRNDRLTHAIASLDAFGAGASTVTSTAYRFERVPGEPELSASARD